MLHPASSAIDKMHRALRHQLDAEYLDARRLYGEAMATAGPNPDALNMLALVELHLGNVDEALRLVEDASRLAPGVPAIQANENLIRHAAGLCKFRDSIFDQAFDAPPAPSLGRPLIHICEVTGDPSGGTEHRAIELANRLMNAADVVLWTQNRNLPAHFTARNAIRLIDESRGVHPRGGMLLVCGSYIRLGAWYKHAEFRRVAVLYNVVDPIGISALLGQACLPGKPKVELLYASEWMRRVTGLPGCFEPSPIDTDRFAPRPGTHGRTEFVVGRLSRDDPVKFHPEAAPFFKALASQGCTVKLMGATPLRPPALEGVGPIQVLRQNAVPAADFLRSLDCFTYRTHPSWTEAWGRARDRGDVCRRSVVAHANGGYAQIIRHGENGFLFNRDSQALELIEQLRRSPALQQAIGQNARRTIVDLCGKSGFERFTRFYLH